MIITKGKNYFNKGIAMAIMYRISNDLYNLTVTECVQALREYGHQGDWVIIEGIWKNRVHGVVWELERSKVAGQLARNLRIKCYSGPPGAKGYYMGSLLTLLMDRVMNLALKEGWLPAKYLFPNEHYNGA